MLEWTIYLQMGFNVQHSLHLPSNVKISATFWEDLTKFMPPTCIRDYSIQIQFTLFLFYIFDCVCGGGDIILKGREEEEWCDVNKGCFYL